ncbi:glutamine synthetase [Acidisoma cellulosilytica]|uniref:Glutamine synthetase n=1 Tax=Acidisoma cellulosilyticum TaxID=2802395 RepID=A0A963YYY1_9PROT|nr:glutamine synthetase family protein [Acidisoma cellulosilyticum]MCB8879476.1 glutamine synthetase [Acidisoma cellulosilyticum]
MTVLPRVTVGGKSKKSEGGAIVEAFVVDGNGVPRGKWVPAEKLSDVSDKGVLIPRSVFAQDIWGRDADEAGLAWGTGDPDGLCKPVEGSVLPISWLSRRATQVMLRMVDTDGSPYFADPRTVLENVLERFKLAGLTPVVATELEFYFIQPEELAGAKPRPYGADAEGWKGWAQNVLSLDELHAYDAIFADIARYANEQNIPLDGMVRENGPDQYELNFTHTDDVVRAADWTVMMKRIVKGAARRHGMDATFMAKPYGGLAGCGMHTHLSLLDRAGANIFVADGHEAGGKLRQVVGGMLNTMKDSMLVLAPHANSYRRLTPATHAPTRLSWGIDNRTAAIRVIEAGLATRVEHRVAGTDTNPYLTLAIILSAALHGLETAAEPPEPMGGEHSQSGAETLPATWDEALARFEASPFIEKAFGKRYQHVFACVKRQEIAEFREHVTEFEYDAYLRTA